VDWAVAPLWAASAVTVAAVAPLSGDVSPFW
jgi:hypothetical protein